MAAKLEDDEAVLCDPLALLADLDPASRYRLAPAHFPPLRKPLCERKRPREDDDSPPVENEPGICVWVEHVHRELCARHSTFCAEWRFDECAGRASASPVPDLAALVRTQQHDVRLRHANCPLPNAPLCAPLLFSALVHNRHGRDVLMHALGCTWVVPRGAAFSLCELRRWRELGPLRPAGGYRLVLLDPPWHSHSVRRKGHYGTLDKQQLLAQLPLPQLACPSCCRAMPGSSNHKGHRDASTD